MAMSGSSVAAALALLAGVVLLGGLVWIVIVMRRISHRLATIRLLLRAIGLRTEPVAGFVANIGANVAAIRHGVSDLERAARRRSQSAASSPTPPRNEPLPPSAGMR